MSLANLSISDLQAELARRQNQAAKLASRRDALVAQLAALDQEIAALGGVPSRGGRGPGKRGPGRPKGSGKRGPMPKNDVTLPDAIAAAMEVRAVVSPKEAADLVLKNGYKSNAKNFGMLVSNALAKDPRFKRLGRGQYERVK